ncbi:MAG: energy-dependent translational throttle protein EttA [Elusimicrobiota bacterium]|jgi:ATP-binding cassette ChvD family protein
MSKDFVFTMKGLSKKYGQKQVLKDITLSFYYGAKIGVIGLNGAGKSTLLKIMAGLETEFDGEAFPGKGSSVGYLPQEPRLDDRLTVKENVAQGLKHVTDLVAEYEKVSAGFSENMGPDAMEKALNRQAELQEKIEACNGWELDHQLEIAMDALRLPPGESPVTHLSGGEKRRVALCRLLLQAPDLLLLDEPTNHLDAESVEWLENHLKEYKGTVVAITHDRYFLDNIAEWILELDYGEGVPWKGNYSSWLEQKQERLRREEKAESQRQKTLERELEWVRMSPHGRQAKSKARIGQYQELLAQDPVKRMEELEIYIPPGPRLGDLVIAADGIAKAYGDNLLVENLSFQIPAGAIVGIIGPNGAGKTTLFKMIIATEKPDQGTMRVGESVKLGYVDQSRQSLDDNKTAWQEISGGLDLIPLGKKEINSRAYCARFNFSGADQQKKVGTLSGGERNRVHLAKMLKSGANVLLLDEPSNDLDVNTLRALEDAILEFAGCVLVISHDRWFLDRIATHILAFEGESQVTFSEGNYREYEEKLKERLGAKALQPHRIHYKKLSHSN